MVHELNHRQIDSLEVTLWWNDEADPEKPLEVSVIDLRDPGKFLHMQDIPGGHALEAFEHPFAYHSHRKGFAGAAQANFAESADGNEGVGV